MTAEPTPRRGGGLWTGALAPLAHRDFRLMLFGRLLSLIGSQMHTVALAWQVYLLTHDPLALGAVGLAKGIPMTLVALWGGVLADARDRRGLLLATSLSGAAMSGLLAFATFEDMLSLPLLYVAAAISGVIVAIDNPARQALLPNLVPRDALTQALSLGTSTYHVAAVVGPSVGGIVLAHAGAGVVYAVDSVSYFAIVASVLAMRYRPTAAPSLRPGLAALLEGIAFLRREPLIRSTMMLDFFATLLGGATQLFPVFANDLFRVGPRGLGLLFAAPSIGAAAMGLYLSLRPPPRAQGPLILWSVGVYGAAMAGFGLTHSFWLGITLLAISGAADTISAVIRQVLRQTLTPDELRGRMTSLQMIFFMGGPQLGEVEAGLVARVAGVRTAVWTGGLGACVLAAYYAWRAPALRRYRA